MKTVEDILIERGELERIYLGELKLQLWRAVHQSVSSGNPLYPDFEPRVVRNTVRRPDLTVDTVDGVEYVLAELGRGTSLFDVSGVFGHKNWTYFEIPAGTEIPDGLIIVKDSYNKKYAATHYTISPNYTMPKSRFVALLDRLAQNAARTASGGEQSRG